MIPVQNTVLSSTFDFWRNRTNEMANYFTTSVVTTDANTSSTPATGNAAITGKFTANTFSAGSGTTNATINTTSFSLANSTVSLKIPLPTAAQSGNSYFLSSNGSWVFVPSSNGQVTTAGAGNPKTIDSYSMTNYNAAEYLLSVKDTTANNYYTTKILTTHDTGTAYVTEYASFTTNTSIGVFSVGTAGGNVILYFTPSSTATVVKFSRTIL